MLSNIYTKLKKPLYSLVVISMLLQITQIANIFKPIAVRAATNIVINEFVSNPSSSGNEWVELFNPTASTIDVTGWRIKDSQDTNFDSALSGNIEAGNYLVVESSASILNNSGDTVRLYNGSLMLIDSKNYGDVNLAAPEQGKSAGRIPNGSDVWQTNLSPTKGTANLGDTTPPTIINVSSDKTNGNYTTGEVIDIDVTFSEAVTSTGNVTVTLETGDTDRACTFTVSNAATGTCNYTVQTGDTSSDLNVNSISGTIADQSSNVMTNFVPTTNLATNKALAIDTTPPIVNAGTDKTTNSQFTQDAIVTGATTYSWTKISGPGTITFGSINSEDTTIKTNVDGSYTIKLTATDLAGNSASDNMILTWDTIAPTGSLKINSGAGVTNSQNVTLALTASADTEKMLISNSSDFSTATTPSWETYAASKNWGLALDKGTKTVYAKFKDQAGNISPIYNASIYYNQSASSVSSQPIVLGTNTATYDNVVITLNAKTDATLTYAKYSTNPETQTTFSVFGGYFDISVNDVSKLHFPVNVKFYYTQVDLDKAGITNEDQILGLYYYDSSSTAWKLYSDTGANIANTTVGGIDYAGYVWANVDHFTPMTLGADNTVPNEPYNFKATAGDSEVKLTWDKVSDADHYDIRYRKATSNDVAVSYSDIYIITNTETTVAGLENGTEYEFNVRAVDKANNKSQWRIIVDTPQKIILTTEKTKTTAPQTSFVAQAYAATPSPTEQQQITNPSSGTEIETEGAVKSEEDQANTAKSTRTAVTLGIIIIAIGAALGGYYGYQWWIGKTEEEEALPKPRKKDYTGKDKEKSKQTRRW